MTGPEGLKAREHMIKGMFTPQTPKPLQEQIMAMMIQRAGSDGQRGHGGDVRSRR